VFVQTGSLVAISQGPPAEIEVRDNRCHHLDFLLFPAGSSSGSPKASTTANEARRRLPRRRPAGMLDVARRS
jgi:hypothetical protein